MLKIFLLIYQLNDLRAKLDARVRVDMNVLYKDIDILKDKISIEK